MTNHKKYYADRFACYPDVVDVISFREMMGGIGDTYARRLIHEGRVKHIFIKPHYWILLLAIFLLYPNLSGSISRSCRYLITSFRAI